MRVLAVIHLGRILNPDVKPGQDVFVYSVCHTVLYSALLAADPRFSMYLPCRIAARCEGDGVILEALRPRDFAHLIGREDIERLTTPLEAVLRELMEETARPGTVVPSAQAKGTYGLGATETQMNVRGALPHRVDSHGTHVEDLAGTGKVDSPGG